MYTIPELGRAGIRFAGRLISGRSKSVAGFYPQQPSCQVPTIWHLYSQFLGERETGTYVEIGAYDGVFVSNTWGLAERGWTGHMVEPVPTLAEACRRNHRYHPRVAVTEVAIGDSEMKELRLFLAGTLTTASETQKKEYESIEWAHDSLTEREIVVPARTLDSFAESVGLEPDFDVLVVDVEGFEAQVFSGFDLKRWKPKMMIVELADTHPDLGMMKSNDAELGRALLSAGYSIVFKDSINTVFVRDDVWRSAFGL